VDGKIKYALHGVKVNAQNFILLHSDDTLLKTIPDINETLLQVTDVMNLVDQLLLLHFSPSASSMTQVINGANVSVWVFV